jgi:hypothetical protein
MSDLKYHTLQQAAHLFEQTYGTVVRLGRSGYYKTVRPFGRSPVLMSDEEVRRILLTPGVLRKRGHPFKRTA